MNVLKKMRRRLLTIGFIAFPGFLQGVDNPSHLLYSKREACAQEVSPTKTTKEGKGEEEEETRWCPTRNSAVYGVHTCTRARTMCGKCQRLGLGLASCSRVAGLLGAAVHTANGGSRGLPFMWKRYQKRGKRISIFLSWIMND